MTRLPRSHRSRIRCRSVVLCSFALVAVASCGGSAEEGGGPDQTAQVVDASPTTSASPVVTAATTLQSTSTSPPSAQPTETSQPEGGLRIESSVLAPGGPTRLETLGFALGITPPSELVVQTRDDGISIIDPDNGVLEVAVQRPVGLVDPTGPLDPGRADQVVAVTGELESWVQDLPLQVLGRGSDLLLGDERPYLDLAIDEADLSALRPGPPILALWNTGLDDADLRVDPQVGPGVSMRVWTIEADGAVLLAFVQGADADQLETVGAWAADVLADGVVEIL